LWLVFGLDLVVNWIVQLIKYVMSLLSCILVACSSQVSDIFVAGIVHTLHIIWTSRNSLRFSSNTVTLHASQVHLHASIAMNGNLSNGKSLLSYRSFLDFFTVPAHHRQISDIIHVIWKVCSPPWLKVNTDGSIIGNQAACGGLFRDHLGSLLGTFTCNLGTNSVFNSEVMGYTIALEFTAQKRWIHIWFESDSTSALMVFNNISLS